MLVESHLRLFDMVLYFGLIFCISVNTGMAESSEPEDQHPGIVVEQTVEEQAVESVDKIALKQSEMLNTIVLVLTRNESGSGTIIDLLETNDKDKYKYLVLTNAHVTHPRFIKQLFGIDSITGKRKTKTIDTGCRVITFNHKEKDWKNYTAKVVSENVAQDFALLSFVSEEKLDVARVPTPDMLEQIRVFDEVFAVGCQLGRNPTPTFGIISQILYGNNKEKGWLIYGTTAQITPGSSGGGLFREYDGHYYLIGIPYKIALAEKGQMIPHLSFAISMTKAIDFIEQNRVSTP